jgi:plasmid replication initiation protein
LDEQRVFRVQAAEFQTRFDVGREKAYQHLKEVADRLFERKVELRDPTTGKINDKIRWVSRCKYLEGKGAVQLHFAPEILPYLSEIRAHFTSYSLNAIAGFSSTFAMRLYELLEQYRRLGKRVAGVEELRRWLDCVDTFERFTDFERWVIKVGVDQINEHSDLRVTYRKIKKGRAVDTIEFSVTRVEPTVQPKKEVPEPKVVEVVQESPDESIRAWRAQMKRYGWDPDKNEPLPGGPREQ